MKKIEVEIKNKAGLHARPSSLFVQVATKFDSEIKVRYDDEEINGKSIMGLMLLAAEQGRKLELEADGSDEIEMLEALKKLIEVEKFGEE
ncbi:HPr family phosphocarrier protein [Fusobacterium sp. MFO224]|uniref:HPr family phosphocarrier protein n=1 Tax=Fusobacterium sp. MFO224 TaxID=3378070 RepID=UPI003853F985